MRLLLTGGAGFIGSHLVGHLAARHSEWTVTVLDALTYAGDPANLKGLADGVRVRLVEGRIEDPERVRELMEEVDAVAHLAAESHVDRSIDDAAPFLSTNVVGTQVLLDAARRAEVRRFLHVSTDEVYGSLGNEGRFNETSPLDPRSPYAASKAAGDHLARAYAHTYGLPVVIVRPSNTYGPRQHVEKFLPVLITNALDGRTLPVYGDGSNVRDWLWVEDLCAGLEAALLCARPGAVLNLGGGHERSNLEVARRVVGLLGLPESRIELVPDRPGHDHRYALDSSRARRTLGWESAVGFDQGLERLVAWYRKNEAWWRPRKARAEPSSRGYWTGREVAAARPGISAVSSAPKPAEGERASAGEARSRARGRSR